MYVSLFRSGATAQNYIGHLRWACMHLGAGSAWDGPTLAWTLKGAKKKDLRIRGGAAHAKVRLTEETLRQLVFLADGLQLKGFASLALVAWEFLLRVQSEALGLQAGTHDDATSLYPGRHSAVWVDSADQLVIRLQRRKNRPHGVDSAPAVYMHGELCSSVRCAPSPAGDESEDHGWLHLGLVGVPISGQAKAAARTAEV